MVAGDDCCGGRPATAGGHALPMVRGALGGDEIVVVQVAGGGPADRGGGMDGALREDLGQSR